jgi:hypothetical protein
MSAEKVAFARWWYARGECPGCGAPLRKVAGAGWRHYLGGHVVGAGSGKWRTTTSGEVIGTGGQVLDGDPRLCSWLPEDLTSLVLIGSGVVKSSGGVGSSPAPTPPVPAA